MGAVAVANVLPVATSTGSRRAVQADVTMSSSYATGGDSVPLGSLGLSNVYEAYTIGGVLAESQLVSSKGYNPNAHGVQVVLAGTSTAPLLKAFSGSTSEVANATNLSTRGVVRVEFRGV